MIEVLGSWMVGKMSWFTRGSGAPPPEIILEQLPYAEPLDVFPSAKVAVDVDERSLVIWQEDTSHGFTGRVVPGQWIALVGPERASLRVDCRNAAGIDVAVFLRPSNESRDPDVRRMVEQLLELLTEMGCHTFYRRSAREAQEAPPRRRAA